MAGVAVPADGVPGRLPPREVDLRAAPRTGAIAGAVAVFVAAVGMIEAFADRMIVGRWVTLSDTMFLLIALGAGYAAGKPPPRLEGYEAARPGARNVAAGAIAGAVAGAMLGVFAVVVDVVSLRSIFVAFTERLVEILTFDTSTGTGLVLLALAGAGLGTLGAAVRVLPDRSRRAALAALGWTLTMAMLQVLFSQIFRGLRAGTVADFLYRGSAGGLEPHGAAVVAAVTFAVSVAVRGRGTARAVAGRVREMPSRRRAMVTLAIMAVSVLILGALPQILGNFLSQALDLAGTYLLMALGLNIVIGFAGLLDLGYVAFFAVGAYTTAVLTSPASPAFTPELTFWMAIPFVMMAAALAGLLVGTPVLRMRGDYLAIVTLGFGEIARLVALSDWQKGTLGGAQGVLRVPSISLGPIDFTNSETFFYLILGFVLLFAYITYALQASRMGRAWNAMREDQAVAEAMGVNIIAAKLWAFVLGAIMASLGGALYAHKLTTVFPHSFSIIVSMTVVVIVIVGGMGSVPGVVLGALVLVGLPELLREFSEYRFLVYGTLLIYMMLRRPEGFIPSRRRQRELHEEETAQDAWLRAEAERQEAEEPSAPEAGRG